MHKLLSARNLCLILIAGIFLTVSLSGCLSPPMDVSHPWATTLRALDPADADTPAHDITAVYLRPSGDMLQIRIDLLDFQNPKDLSIEILIESDATPQPPPLIIYIPTSAASTRVRLDPLLDTVIVEVPLSETPSRPRVDVYTPEDKITNLTLDGPVPNNTVPLLLTFYDTFAGRFPAEALRSWDGAHTGPRGERHGLKHLLEAAEEYRIPVALFDLGKPENLSVLDAMGILPTIETLENQGLLIFPENDFQFIYLENPTHLYRPLFSKTTYLPIASETDTNQPTPEGPSLEVRRALLDTALNADDQDLLVLGGSFQYSTWGNPDMVGVTMAYFASRPYIHVLSADDLMDFPTRSGKPEELSGPSNKPLSDLESHYRDLTQPVLSFAQHWEGSPISACGSDVDKDGGVECVLAGDNYLAILDPQGARLTYLFAVERDTFYPSQLIGPSWQVAVGLSNPSTWDLSAGEAADSGAYPGAFADADDPFKPYEPVIDGKTVTFISLDGTLTKTFKLTETGIEVEYQVQETITTQIPLLVEPDTRFTPGWVEMYIGESVPNGISWGVVNGPMVSIQADGPVTMRAFNESLPLLAMPEDPDFSYPPGHFVPFPMAIVEVEINGRYSLSIERK